MWFGYLGGLGDGCGGWRNATDVQIVFVFVLVGHWCLGCMCEGGVGWVLMALEMCGEEW